MKKTLIKITKRVVLMILILSLALTGCAQGEEEVDSSLEGIEDGFTCETYFPSFIMGVRSNKSRFNVNNVCFDIYIGQTIFDGTKYYGEHLTAGKASLYVFNDSNIVKLTLRTEKPLTSKDYYAKYANKKITYNYCEALSIPRDLFSQNEGCIIMTLRATVYDNYNDRWKCEEPADLCFLRFDYKMVDENIVELSKWEKNYMTEDDVDYLDSIWPTEWPEE